MEAGNSIQEIKQKYDHKTYQIIGAALEVHKRLGCGFYEQVYGDALAIELAEQGIPFEREKEISIKYKGNTLSHHYYADFVCFGDIIVELKALNELTSIHESQVLNYLRGTGNTVGLLLNFGQQSLTKKRIFNFHNTPFNPADPLTKERSSV